MYNESGVKMKTNQEKLKDVGILFLFCLLLLAAAFQAKQAQQIEYFNEQNHLLLNEINTCKHKLNSNLTAELGNCTETLKTVRHNYAGLADKYFDHGCQPQLDKCIYQLDYWKGKVEMSKDWQTEVVCDD